MPYEMEDRIDDVIDMGDHERSIFIGFPLCWAEQGASGSDEPSCPQEGRFWRCQGLLEFQDAYPRMWTGPVHGIRLREIPGFIGIDAG